MSLIEQSARLETRVFYSKELGIMNASSMISNSPSFHIRGYKHSDGPLIGQLFKKVYGKHYLDPRVYDPNSLTQAVESGELLPVISETNEGEVVGYMALARRDEQYGLYELAQAVVRQDQRGKLVFKSMLEASIAAAENLPECRLIFAEPVTNHLNTQVPLARAGFRDVGLCYGLVPPAMMKIEDTNSLPVSTLMQVRITKPGQSQTVYIPDCYAELAALAFRSAGILRQIVSSTEANQNTARSCSGDLTAIDSVDNGILRLEIKKFGKEIIEEIQKAEKKAYQDGRRVIYCHLRINTPESVHVAAALHKAGYVFSAVLPFWRNSDVLALQKNLTSVRHRMPAVFSRSGQEIVRAIEEQMACYFLLCENDTLRDTVVQVSAAVISPLVRSVPQNASSCKKQMCGQYVQVKA